VNVALVDCIYEGCGMHQVGIGVVTSEIFEGNAVLGDVLEAELLFEDSDGIWAGDSTQSIEEEFEVCVFSEKGLDEVEVEDLFHECDIVGCGIDNFDGDWAIFFGTDGCKINIWNVGDFVGCKALGDLVDFVGDGFWCWSSIGKIVLDTKVLIRTYTVSDIHTQRLTILTTWVMTGCK
jgi:hypothetical protein